MKRWIAFYKSYIEKFYKKNVRLRSRKGEAKQLSKRKRLTHVPKTHFYVQDGAIQRPIRQGLEVRFFIFA